MPQSGFHIFKQESRRALAPTEVCAVDVASASHKRAWRRGPSSIASIRVVLQAGFDFLFAPRSDKNPQPDLMLAFAL